MSVALQASWQSRSVGQATPQIPPRMLFSLMVRMAPLMLRILSFQMNFPGSVSAGQLLVQGASWHSRHLPASATAWDREYPASMWLTFSTLLVFLLADFNISPPSFWYEGIS